MELQFWPFSVCSQSASGLTQAKLCYVQFACNSYIIMYNSECLMVHILLTVIVICIICIHTLIIYLLMLSYGLCYYLVLILLMLINLYTYTTHLHGAVGQLISL